MSEGLPEGIGSTEFKDSLVGRIPVGWEVSKMMKVADVDSTSLKSTTNPNFKFFYIDISSVKTGKINKPTNKICFKESPSRARRIIQSGDVLMATVRPNLQSFAYFDGGPCDYICSTGFSVLRPKNNNDGRFIYNTLFSENVSRQIDSLVVGSNYPAINSTDVKNLLIPKPSPKEQQKIAQILTSVDEVIEKTEAQIHKLKDLKKGMMNELLTKGIGHTEFKDSPVGRIPVEWEVVKLNSVCHKITDGEHQTPERTDKGVYLLSARNVKEGYLALDDVDYISVEEYNRLSKRVCPKKNDILISCSGTIGRTAIVPDNLTFSMVRSVAILQPKNEKVSSHFLVQQIASQIVQEQIKKGLSQLAQANLFQGQIKEFDIAVPPLPEQQKIASILTSIDTNIVKKQAKLTQTKNLKKSLMADLLTGRVRVKVN